MIPKELLKKIRQIELRTRRLVDETLAGQYHSAFKGQGMDFDEVREYQPGDEVRAIDWNVTARSDVPYVKLVSIRLRNGAQLPVHSTPVPALIEAASVAGARRPHDTTTAV